MAGPRKTSPIVHTYLKRSMNGVQARIYSHKHQLDKTAVGRNLEQAIQRLQHEIDQGLRRNKRK